MNDKQKFIEEVLNIVVECCRVEVFDVQSLTIKDITGPNRCESVNMSRSIFVSQMVHMGYSRTTIANILHRSEKTIGNILQQADAYRNVSYAYRLADAEVTLKIKEIMPKL